VTEVERLKIRLYDVIERQAVLHAENDELEKLKAQLCKELNAARSAQAKSTESVGGSAPATHAESQTNCLAGDVQRRGRGGQGSGVEIGRMNSVDELKKAGFLGFRTFAELRDGGVNEIPEQQGVYLALRTDTAPPTFLAASTGGHSKRRNPTVDVAILSDAWVAKAITVYIGKAGGSGVYETLRSRIRLYMRFGGGAACGHWGGRFVWQLADAEQLTICWKETPNREPRDVERHIINGFLAKYGKLPFANCQR
jgi:hypothetical protein